MADATTLTARIAIALSLVAVITVGVAVVVVVSREAPATTPQPTPVASQPPAPAPAPVPRNDEIHTVRAVDVVRLDRDTVEVVTGGIKVKDRALRTALVLEAGDVITAISGRPIERPFDVLDALLGASLMRATTLYVELDRGGAPKLVRWRLDGDLREARKAARTR